MSSTSDSKHPGNSENSDSTNRHKAASSRLTPVITSSRRSSRAPSPAVSERKKTSDQTATSATGSTQVRLTEEQINRLAAKVEEKKVLAKVIKQCIRLARHRGWDTLVIKANPESGSDFGVSLDRLFEKLQAIDTFSLDSDEVKPIKTDFLRYFKEQCDLERAALEKVEAHDKYDLFGFGSTDRLNIDLSPNKLSELHDALVKVLRINEVK